MTEVEAAREFWESFTPRDGVDYGWVLEHAQAQYAAAQTTFKELDDKAASLITSLGGGTGLLTVGSLAALGAGSVSPWVALAALPAFAYAVSGIRAAAAARDVCGVAQVPNAAEAARFAEDYHPDGRAAFLRQWVYTTASMWPVLERKADHVERANRRLVAAVTLLGLPLLAAVAAKFLGPTG